MIIVDVDQNTPQWDIERLGDIGGSKINNLYTESLPTQVVMKDELSRLNIDYSSAKKSEDLYKLLPKESQDKFFYQQQKAEYFVLLAERLCIPQEEDTILDPRSHGHFYEDKAAELFETTTGINTEKTGMWRREDYPSIYISPDRGVRIDGIFKEALEIKCLGSAKHIQAVLTDKIPTEYMKQVIQYFVVNDDLDKLYFVFYDFRFEYKPLHVIEFTREQLKDEIKKIFEYEINILKHLEEDVLRLTF